MAGTEHAHPRHIAHSLAPALPSMRHVFHGILSGIAEEVAFRQGLGSTFLLRGNSLEPPSHRDDQPWSPMSVTSSLSPASAPQGA